MLKRVVCLLGAAAVLAGCSPGEPPIEVAVKDIYRFGAYGANVTISTKDEQVEIQDVQINQGECAVSKMRDWDGNLVDQVPKKIAPHDYKVFYFQIPCPAHQVTVVTDQGQWTWNH